ncbi:MAG: hypothetical protein LM632_05515 [Armatimonadetes bacterium]|nr:hypothetical protein [Armatimonadota bacterium]
MGERGSCRAKTAASSEWRIANSERQIATGETANGDWRIATGSFLEGSASALPPNFFA